MSLHFTTHIPLILFSQIIKNQIDKNAEALSPVFLSQWFLGDSTNLIGAFLTNQLATQILTAIYFVFVDFVLLGQWVGFWVQRRRKKRVLHFSDNDFGDGNKLYAFLLAFALLSTFSIVRLNFPAPQFRLNSSAANRVLLSNSRDETGDAVGTFFGWISALFYLGSRIPQIIKNVNFFICSYFCKNLTPLKKYQRKTTEGLAIVMFVFAVLGNVTYASSIFLYSVEWVFLSSKLPWLIGSLGTLVFDFTILFQYLYYRKKKSTKYNPVRLNEEDSNIQLSYSQMD